MFSSRTINQYHRRLDSVKNKRSNPISEGFAGTGLATWISWRKKGNTRFTLNGQLKQPPLPAFQSWMLLKSTRPTLWQRCSRRERFVLPMFTRSPHNSTTYLSTQSPWIHHFHKHVFSSGTATDVATNGGNP